MEQAPGPVTRINGKEYLYFAGTSYYNLHSHPEVIAAARQAMEMYGMNSATTRNGYGTTPLLASLEKEAAAFFGTEQAVCVASGYLTSMAGLGGMMHLNPFDIIFADQYAHYSIQMAANALRIETVTFLHRDPADLEQKLRKHLKLRQRPVLVTDGIFAVYGDVAPLPQYLDILEPYDGWIWIDDAHASGVGGKTGKGTLEYYNMQSDRVYTGSTLSKAFGGFGGIVIGGREFIQHIIGDPAMNGASLVPVPALAAAKKGIELLSNHPEWRDMLSDNAGYLKTGLRKMGVDLNDSPAPIAAFTPDNESRMASIQKELMKKGIAIQHIRYIGTPPAGALRIVVFSTHTQDQIDYLLNTLKTTL
ncbi:MAG: pyridoxal phosphate-dependent aminotransferase family protein [Chlorobi bacterium]|nr:pyridoxal phosphate-dependent aminotransferase family protein [Chlorobiota bacterium]